MRRSPGRHSGTGVLFLTAVQGARGRLTMGASLVERISHHWALFVASSCSRGGLQFTTVVSLDDQEFNSSPWRMTAYYRLLPDRLHVSVADEWARVLALAPRQCAVLLHTLFVSRSLV